MARDENYFQEKKLKKKDGRTNIQDVHASWKKVKCGEFVARVTVLRFLLVKKIGVNQDCTCALSWQWPFNCEPTVTPSIAINTGVIAPTTTVLP